MPKCVYCGKMYDVPRGMTFIKTDGTIQYFCSAKCRKNMAMKRRKVRWISKMKKSKRELKAEVLAEAKEEVKEKLPEVPEEKPKEKTHAEEKSKEEKKPEEKEEDNSKEGKK